MFLIPHDKESNQIQNFFNKLFHKKISEKKTIMQKCQCLLEQVTFWQVRYTISLSHKINFVEIG